MRARRADALALCVSLVIVARAAAQPDLPADESTSGTSATSGTSSTSEQSRAQSSAPAPAAEQELPADADPSMLLAMAEEAMTTLDYERARALGQRAIEQGGLNADEVARAYA